MSAESARERKPPDHLIGETLANRYLIEERLGEGAMGAVYRARHVKVGRIFAVKVLHRTLLDDNKVAQRFDREAELAGRLSHPNVIGVVDVGETSDGLRYMVMDFAEGEDLAGLLAEAPFPRERVVTLARQLLEGLFHAHEAGLIHRDFKPENVIITRNDHGEEVPRIVDFGIAILREGGSSASSEGRLTTNGLVLGTPHYMAPEQAVADPIDHRIDLFALGIVIYEMLSGKLPFDGTGAEVARANLLLDPPRISARVPFLEVDQLLEAFARRLMAKKRDQRPPTARDARELLDMIEREPELAAELLGVPKEATGRIPATTMPSQPQRIQDFASADSSGDLPIAREAAPMPQATKLRAPTPVPTEDVVPMSRRSRRTFFIVAAAVLAALIAIVAIKKASSSGDKKEEVVAMTPTPPAPEPKPTPTPPPPVVPLEVEAPAAIVDAGVAEAPVAKKPPLIISKKPVVKELPPVQVEKIAQRVEEPEHPVQGGVISVPTVTDVNALYGSVGRDIKAVEKKKGDAAADQFWKRYRQIQIQSATKTPELRTSTTQTLRELDADVKKSL